MAVIEDFVVSKKINYVCMASSQNRFVLPNLPITVNVKRHYVFCVRVKKCLTAAFMKMNSS